MPASKPRGLMMGILLAAVLLVAAALMLPARAQETVDQEKLNRGARIYQENCAVCHGPNGEGRVGATLSKNWPSIRPELVVESTIANGIAGTVMPAWGQAKGGPLSDAQISDVAYYILSWQSGGPPPVDLGPTATPRPQIEPVPGVVGDPNQGALLYDENCAVCHGPEGKGRIGVNISNAFPSIRPDLSIKNIIVNGVSGSPMPAWSQANGGPLTDQQINDITSFVLALEASSSSGAATPTVTPVVAQTNNTWLIWVGAFVALVLIGLWFARRTK
jgi:LPXTG-motif cell wall-anchored protein